MANSLVYGKWKLRQMGNPGAGTYTDLDSGTIKVALMNATYAALSDATKHGHEFWSDVSSNEVGASGTYSAGGSTLASKTSAQSAGTYTFDAADPTAWTGATIAAAGCIIWEDTAGASTTDPVIAYLDFGGTITSTAGTFTLVFNASGIFTIS
jgi:hypothetical protein